MPARCRLRPRREFDGNAHRIRSPWHAFVAGASYRFSRPDLVTTIEYAADRYDETAAVPYLLSDRLLGKLDWTLFDQTLTVSLASLVEFDGPSAAFLVSAFYQSFESVEARLGISFFTGGDGTDLGQFAGNRMIAGAVRVWF